MTTRNDSGPQGYCGFEVGQHVVCVRPDPTGQLSLNKVYTVREVKMHDKANHRPSNGEFLRLTGGQYLGLRLKEIRVRRTTQGAVFQGNEDAPFNVDRFRPLPKLRVEDFLAASTPKDVVSA